MASGGPAPSSDPTSAPSVSSRAAKTAAVLLILAALLSVSPLSAVALTRSGAEWLGMAATSARSPLILASGVLQLLAPAIVLMLLVAAVGSWRARRRAAVLGWTALALSVALLVGPMSAVSPASWLPLGRWLAVAVAVAAAVALVGVWRGGRRGASRVGRWTAGGFLAVVGVIALLAGVAGGLPGAPLPVGSGHFRTGPGVVEPFTAAPQPQNPAMAAFPFAGIHNDAAQTDLYTDGISLDPATADLRSFVGGGGCASLAWDSHGRIATVCVSDAVTAYLLDPTTLTELARYRISDRPLSKDFLTDFGGGGYMYLNADDEIVTPTLQRTILVLGQVPVAESGGVELRPRVEYDLAGALLPDERPTSALPDSGGRIWFVGQRGTVGYIDPSSGTIEHRQWPGEDIENSFATGESEDVYVVSSSALRRLTAAPDGIQVQWETPYDSGSGQKPGQTSAASGTTPTLHGDGLVSIADNGDVTHVDVFRRADGARVCHTPVLPAGSGATENSLIALGADLVVENNYGYTLFGTTGGHSTAPGLVRVAVDAATGCSVRWRNDTLSVPSAVSKASAGDGIVLTYTKDDTWWGTDRWWITAVGLGDGQVVWQRLAGSGSARNNHYAGVYISPRGDILVGTLMGIVALQAPDGPGR